MNNSPIHSGQGPVHPASARSEEHKLPPEPRSLGHPGRITSVQNLNTRQKSEPAQSATRETSSDALWKRALQIKSSCPSKASIAANSRPRPLTPRADQHQDSHRFQLQQSTMSTLRRSKEARSSTAEATAREKGLDETELNNFIQQLTRPGTHRTGANTLPKKAIKTAIRPPVNDTGKRPAVVPSSSTAKQRPEPGLLQESAHTRADKKLQVRRKPLPDPDVSQPAVAAAPLSERAKAVRRHFTPVVDQRAALSDQAEIRRAQIRQDKLNNPRRYSGIRSSAPGAAGGGLGLKAGTIEELLKLQQLGISSTTPGRPPKPATELAENARGSRTTGNPGKTRVTKGSRDRTQDIVDCPCPVHGTPAVSGKRQTGEATRDTAVVVDPQPEGAQGTAVNRSQDRPFAPRQSFRRSNTLIRPTQAPRAKEVTDAAQNSGTTAPSASHPKKKLSKAPAKPAWR